MKEIVNVWLLLTVVFLSSCGMFRDVSKKAFRKKAKTEIKTTTDEKVTVKELDKGKLLTVDKGVTVTESSSTRAVNRRGIDYSVSVDMLSLKRGGWVSKDYAGIKLKMMLDSVGNVLNIEVQTPDETITETTNTKVTENKNITRNEQRDTEKDSTTQIAATIQHTATDELATKDVERKGKNAFWWMIAVVGSIAVAVWLVVKRFKTKI